MPYYNVIRATDSDVIFTWESQELAMNHAQELTQRTSVNHYAKKAPDLKWRDRELRRFCDGQYEPLPWSNELWWTERPEELRDHYAHKSQEKDSMVAFTESPEKGEQDRQTRIKCGVYLTRFFSDVLSAQEIQTWCRLFAGDDGESFSYSLTTTPDEAEEVYRNGPASCMSCDFGHGPHPARVYGGHDLAIAYIKKGASYHEETYASRAVVWPERKLFGRIYPTPERYDSGYRRESARQEYARLERALRADGYESGSFEGARIGAIRIDDSVYAMPYLDGASGVTLSSCEDFFMISKSGNLHAQETSGRLDVNSGMICERCEDTMDEDDSYCISTGRNSSEQWCEHCYSSHSFFCHGYEQSYSDDTESVQGNDHNTYSLAYAERNFGWCEHTDEWITDGNVQTVNVSKSGGTENWGQDSCYEDAFYCNGSGEYYWSEAFESVEIDGEIYEKEHAEGDLVLRAKLHENDEETETETVGE